MSEQAQHVDEAAMAVLEAMKLGWLVAAAKARTPFGFRTFVARAQDAQDAICALRRAAAEARP